MDTPSVAAREPAPSGSPPTAICPHLRLREDPATSAAYAHRRQACFGSDPPSLVHPKIQERFCLAARYPLCPVFRGKVERPPRPPFAWPRLGWRQAAIHLLSGVIVPAALGASLALLIGDGSPSRAPRPSVAVVSAAEGATNDPETAGPADASDVVVPVEPADEASEDAASSPAETEPAPESTPAVPSAEEALLAWPTLIERVVGAGDTLFVIALESSTTVEAIVRYNGLPDETIVEGQALVIPVNFNRPLEESPAAGPDGAGPDGAETDAPPVDETAPVAETAEAVLLAWPDVVEYQVGGGDSLFIIALEFGTTAEAIERYNGLSDDAIFAGQALLIPVNFRQSLEEPPVESVETVAEEVEEAPPLSEAAALEALQARADVVAYPVVQGDSLFVVALRFGTTVEAILALNEVARGGLLEIGTLLLVPRGFSAVVGEPAFEPGAPPLFEAETLATLQAWPTVIAYVVVAGDSLATIAEAAATTVDAIATLSEIARGGVLEVGDVLRVPLGFQGGTGATGLAEPAPVDPEALALLQAWPAVITYVVEEGDSLGTIADATSTTVEAIEALNGLAPNALLAVGVVLQLPLGFTTPLSLIGAG